MRHEFRVFGSEPPKKDIVQMQFQEESQTSPDPFEAFTRNKAMMRLQETSTEHEMMEKTLVSHLGNLATQVKVSAVHKKLISGVVAEAWEETFKIFEKAVADKCGGDANVMFAWYGASLEEIAQIVSFGFSRCSKTNGVSHGFGIYLTRLKCLLDCLPSCVPDKYGIRHILLCRVIRGKAEVILANSKQSHPSSREFDSGVDNLVDPRRFVVWEAFMNSHILPHTIISFTIPSLNAQNLPRAKLVPAVSTPAPGMIKALPNSTNHGNEVKSSPRALAGNPASLSSLKNGVNDAGAGAVKPNAEMINFPALYGILSRVLERPKMDLLRKCFDDFRKNKITGSHLIERTRQIAGVDLFHEIVKKNRDKVVW